MWIYQGKLFTHEEAQKHFGFVYLITHIPSGKKYVGQKKLTSTRTLPPLKGKLRKRKVTTASDWTTYYGSNTTLKELAANEPATNFTREILHLCPNKQTMNYLELYEQVTRNALLDENYFNDYIGGRITSKGIKL